ncbi:hypothetical protein O7626_21800 [Micromonospora sp. WMMD1102]|nr:hypothetical protein [Micromonospora sp. WMMD1102]MDG4788537.1 hypothetical protein [Micromonospora sp. WMMD1102]
MSVIASVSVVVLAVGGLCCLMAVTAVVMGVVWAARKNRGP